MRCALILLLLFQVLATKPDPELPDEMCVSKADMEEFLILRGVYNVFMGLDHIPDDRLNHPKHYDMDYDMDYNIRDTIPVPMEYDLDHVPSSKTRFQPVIDLLNAYREKNFALYFRLRKRCIPGSPLDDLCGIFDDMFRCYFMKRIAKSFKTEEPNISLYSWLMRFKDTGEFMAFCERAQIDIGGKVKTQMDLLKAIDESPKMNIRHAMR